MTPEQTRLTEILVEAEDVIAANKGWVRAYLEALSIRELGATTRLVEAYRSCGYIAEIHERPPSSLYNLALGLKILTRAPFGTTRVLLRNNTHQRLQDARYMATPDASAYVFVGREAEWAFLLDKAGVPCCADDFKARSPLIDGYLRSWLDLRDSLYMLLYDTVPDVRSTMLKYAPTYDFDVDLRPHKDAVQIATVQVPGVNRAERPDTWVSLYTWTDDRGPRARLMYETQSPQWGAWGSNFHPLFQDVLRAGDALFEEQGRMKQLAQWTTPGSPTLDVQAHARLLGSAIPTATFSGTCSPPTTPTSGR